MDDRRRLDARASIVSFVATCAIAAGAATGLFVLLDPRAQTFWVARWSELVAVVQGFFGR